jgi:hypothetical protein
MSDTWKHSRDSIHRLRQAWGDADEDSRYKLVFWMTGMAMMAGAIVSAFGWPGFVFCLGFVVWAAGTSA